MSKKFSISRRSALLNVPDIKKVGIKDYIDEDYASESIATDIEQLIKEIENNVSEEEEEEIIEHQINETDALKSANLLIKYCDQQSTADEDILKCLYKIKTLTEKKKQ